MSSADLSFVLAQTNANSKAAAQRLFETGLEQMKQKEYGNACKNFEDSQKLDPGVGTLLYLAECYEKSGKTASAWATFREAESAAKVANQTSRVNIAKQRAAKLEPLLSYLTITVDSANDASLEIRRDGESIPKGIWNRQLPIDPGEHQIVASAPKKKSWSQSVTVPTSAGSISINIPVLEADSATEGSTPTPATSNEAPMASIPRAAPSNTTTSVPIQDSTSNKSSGLRTAGITLTILGAVGVGVGSFFGVQAISKNRDAANNHCTNNLCDPEGVRLTSSAKDNALASTILVGLGLATLTGGILMWTLSPSSTSSSSASKSSRLRHIYATPSFDAQSVGFLLGGRF